ncbi:hypothetical protein B5F40_03070 [Gordonibacter sp. An230]|uniref:hypothetical protein n=1 Tax=Gordonibacter sp. An230 TaxID=1965592 RepID=UPI000B3A1470|nr:hypothetical protein [Gordonibacter sp. An230]OUO91438.1 hypothetical protein B5F40_03070 [Gordonibacter sp. An230]
MQIGLPASTSGWHLRHHVEHGKPDVDELDSHRDALRRGGDDKPCGIAFMVLLQKAAETVAMPKAFGSRALSRWLRA